MATSRGVTDARTRVSPPSADLRQVLALPGGGRRVETPVPRLAEGRGTPPARRRRRGRPDPGLAPPDRGAGGGVRGRPPRAPRRLRRAGVGVRRGGTARLEYDDSSGTCDTLYARRAAGAFRYRVWFDGSGEWAYDFEGREPLSRRD